MLIYILEILERLLPRSNEDQLQNPMIVFQCQATKHPSTILTSKYLVLKLEPFLILNKGNIIVKSFFINIKVNKYLVCYIFKYVILF